LPPPAAGSHCPSQSRAPQVVRGSGHRSARQAARLALPGAVRFDNYNQAWGKQEQLDRLVQAYAVEKSKIEARKRGHHVVEQPLTDGSIKLTIQVGGAA
jgi:hypothetical protein